MLLILVYIKNQVFGTLIQLKKEKQSKNEIKLKTRTFHFLNFTIITQVILSTTDWLNCHSAPVHATYSTWP